MTPDCVGSVINVQIYDSEGLKTEVQYLDIFAPCMKGEKWLVLPRPDLFIICFELCCVMFYSYYSSADYLLEILNTFVCFSLKLRSRLQSWKPNPRLQSNIKSSQGGHQVLY